MTQAPDKKQQRHLRLMILIGVTCMTFFVITLCSAQVRGYRPLYYLLIVTFIYTAFKILYEWYHYWAISAPAQQTPNKSYTVDIFTTFCAGEPYEMIVETLEAIQQITYPHQAYLCDEDNDTYLKEVCARLGVHHVTRTDRTNAKAGNINNALKYSTGELCVVLDPDHVPQPDFLDPIVGHFNDPEIGFVQIVQGYANQNESWVAKGAAQQTYQFYGPMMMTMNTYSTVQTIGANCTFRRTAFDSIGGHAPGLAEDMHTAMRLHAQGWRSVYVPAILERGLVPATLSAYYKQQLKWSRGVFELLVTAYVELFRKFNWRQKLHYGLIPFYYLSGFIFLINFLIPVTSLFTDVYPLRMNFSYFLVISLPFIASVILIRLYAQRWVSDEQERGFHVIGGLLLIGTWWVFITGFFYTIIRKEVPYISTPKKASRENNLRINLPNIFILALSVSAIIYGLINDWNPFTMIMAGICGVNCLFMVFMLIASRQLKTRNYLQQHNALVNVSRHIGDFKKAFWLARRRLYSLVRSAGLVLLVLIAAICFYIGSSVRPAGILYQPVSQAAVPVILPVADIAKPVYGVIYTKGQHWYGNTYAITKNEVEADLIAMQKAGINTIRIFGPNVYDKITLRIAQKMHMRIHYSFWVPLNVATDINQLNELGKDIIGTVKKYKDDSTIIAWNMGNSVLQQMMANHVAKVKQLAYLAWLNDLARQIKISDSTRPLMIDAMVTPTLKSTAGLLHDRIPQIDQIGLVLTKGLKDTGQIKELPLPYYYSNVTPQLYFKLKADGKPVFFSNWQDQQTAAGVTFDGLKDIWGRNKTGFEMVVHRSAQIPDQLPDIKIMRPALTVEPGTVLPFSALVYKYNTWHLGAYLNTGLQFEWYEVRTDKMGNALELRALGKGGEVNYTVPQHPELYRLYLIAARGNRITTAYSILNLPLK